MVDKCCFVVEKGQTIGCSALEEKIIASVDLKICASLGRQRP